MSSTNPEKAVHIQYCLLLKILHISSGITSAFVWLMRVRYSSFTVALVSDSWDTCMVATVWHSVTCTAGNCMSNLAAGSWGITLEVYFKMLIKCTLTFMDALHLNFWNTHCKNKTFYCLLYNMLFPNKVSAQFKNKPLDVLTQRIVFKQSSSADCSQFGIMRTRKATADKTGHLTSNITSYDTFRLLFCGLLFF